MKSRLVSDRVFSFVLVGTILISLFAFSDAFAANTVNDRKSINSDDFLSPPDLANGDLFGYQIEAIGDLDGDGVTDLASIKFSDDSGDGDAGSIMILFMNLDGSVKSANEITMEDNLTNGIGNVCLPNVGSNRDDGTLEQMAFVGDLNGDGKPTLALGANSNDHPIANSGAVYMLELNSNGTVDNCVLITEDSGGFDPGAGVYRQSAEGQAANFGWPVIATDLDGDGQKELIVGATSDDDNYTDLWVLFLNSTGGVDSHPATPIFGNGDIGIDSSEYLSDGKSISGTKIVVSNENDGDGGGSVFIVNLSSAGAFVSSTEIAGSGLGIPNDQRFGSGVAPLGDMNSDGVIDILVGNEAGDDTNSLSGEVYILLLNSDDTLKESQKISNESEDLRNGTTPFEASDLFGQGMSVWLSNSTEVVVAIGAPQNNDGGADRGAIHLFYIEITQAETIVKKSGGSSGDTTPSTLGLTNGKRMVENGFSFNGKTVNVDNYHTEFPLLSVLVGFPNTVEMKIYENGGLSKIKRVQFGLGVKEVGTPLSESDVIILINLHHNGTSVESIDYEGDKTLLVLKKTNVELSIVKCKANSFAECLLVSLTYTYRESPRYPMMIVNTMDDRRNSWNFYFNDGVKVIGSMNPPATTEIFVKNVKQERGEFMTLTQIDKINDIWKDIYYIEYQHNKGDYIRITPHEPWTCNDPPLDQINVPTRQNCNFRALTTIWG